MAVPIHLVSYQGVLSGAPGTQPIPGVDFTHSILAEGDSWFTLGGLPPSNLLGCLTLAQSAIVASLAFPGEWLADMANFSRNDSFKGMLAKRGNPYRYNAILLSGGGNDLIGTARAFIRADPSGARARPESYIESDRFDTFIADIRRNFESIIDYRDRSSSVCPGIPLITHTYDYPTPRPFGAFNRGWLWPVFESKGTPLELRQPITDLLLDRYAAALEAMTHGRNALPSFHVINTLGTLERAKLDAANSNDWLNEIHPNLRGYRKLARKWAQVIDGLLG